MRIPDFVFKVTQGAKVWTGDRFSLFDPIYQRDGLPPISREDLAKVLLGDWYGVNKSIEVEIASIGWTDQEAWGDRCYSVEKPSTGAPTVKENYYSIGD